MKTYQYEKSHQIFDRAVKVIPCGIYGHLSPAPLIPVQDYPFYAQRAQGARFWDVDGNEFIDYMCAYGPMVLGYNHPAVDEAAARQQEKGNCVTLPAPVMVDLAEYLVELMPVADWAFFAKNGNDVTSFALMIARAQTGRKKVILFKGGYHGVAPWCQAPGHHGITDDDYKHFIRIPWNDYQTLERVVEENKGQIAALMATPYHHPTFADNELPAEGFWPRVEALCRKQGIVLVIDDVRCGFRLDLRGSHEYFGFTPDLVCLCKAIGNGYPISVLVGQGEFKQAAAKVFYTGSYWFQAVPMAAALATLQELVRIDGAKKMQQTGEKLLSAMVQVAQEFGYELKVTGVPSMPYLRITNDPSMMLHQDWCAACTRRGAFFSSHHNWFISTAHQEQDIEQTVEICRAAFKEIEEKYGDRFKK